MKLQWPSQVAINPLEGSLYFIDDHMVLRLTPDRRVMIIAGQPNYCKSERKRRGVTAFNDTDQIGSFTNFAFGPSGEL